MHLLAILFLAAAPVSVESQLKARTQELADAVAPGNVAVWRRYLDDEAVVTAEDGSVQTKSEIIRDFRPLPQGVSGRIDVIDFHARVHDRVAIATYVMDEHENYHGQELHCQYRETDTWLKKAEGWRLIASQVLALLGAPPAMAISDAMASSYVGTYQLAPGITYEIRRDAGTLQGRRGESGKWETLIPEAPDVLFVPGKLRYRKIVQRDADGKVTGFAERREAWDLVWKRISSSGSSEFLGVPRGPHTEDPEEPRNSEELAGRAATVSAASPAAAAMPAAVPAAGSAAAATGR